MTSAHSRGGNAPNGDPVLQNVVEMLRRRRTIMALGASAVFGIVAAVTYLLPETYESKVTFLLQKPDLERTEALDVLERSGSLGEIETELGLIEGRSVAEPVVDAFDLHAVVRRDDETVSPRSIFRDFQASRDAVPGLYEFVQGQDGLLLVQRGDSTIFSAEPGEPVELHRRRFSQVTKTGQRKAPEDPTEGLLLWIEGVDR